MIDIVIDLETTVNGGVDGTSPEAHYSNNRVLLAGWSVSGVVHTSDNMQELGQEIMFQYSDHSNDITIIGHNLKFDLKYLIRELPEIPWHEFNYYCTMYGEYRLTGHRDKFVGLEAGCAHRGIAFTKGLDLGAILASGVKMEDIPIGDLEQYLIEDVKATTTLFTHQRAEDPYLFANHTLALARIELNGLLLDMPHAQSLMKHLVTDETAAGRVLWTYYKRKLEWDDGTMILPSEIKVNAPRTISYMLTGTPSTGLVKGKKAIVFQPGQSSMLTGGQVVTIWGSKQPTHLGFPVPADILKDLTRYGVAYGEDVLRYRGIQKLMNTYIGPFLEEAKVQDTIHPKLNQCQTNTGRLSSSKPNGQNLPLDARMCFKSEYGKLRDIDFRQLEVCALAAVTKDIQLIADLNSGVDVHYETGKRVMGWKKPEDMKKKERTIVKNVNFGLIYGGGAAGLAAQTGQPKALIKQLIAEFYKRYPNVAVWQHNFYLEVTNNLKPAGIEQGEQVYDSMVELPISKRKFYFKESLSPVWLRKKTGRKYSFKPTETKNYPVQGFAGGDIVMEALCYLNYLLEAHKSNTAIRMTVHDSILVDTGMSEVRLAGYMNQVCSHLESLYSLPFNLRFDITSGTHWQ